MSGQVLLGSRYLLSLEEFSLLTGLSLRTTTKLISNGEVRSICVGKRRLISRTELERFSRRDHTLKRNRKLKRTRPRKESACRKQVGR